MKTRLTIFLLLACVAASAARAQTPSGAAARTLTDAQVQALKSIKAESEKKAAPLALQLAATAKQIYENMLSDKEDAALRQKLDRELHETAGKLLDIKGQSIREMVAVLTPAQKQLVREEMRKPGAPGDLSELIERLFNSPEQ